MEARSRIALFGLGYVGCVTAACLARLGHRVTGVDRDEFKVRSVMSGRAPFFEPDLDDLVRSGVDAGRLRASTTASEALADAEVAMLCVGTPSTRNGDVNVEQIERVCSEIAACLNPQTAPPVVAIRSTVFPGTCERIVVPLLGPKVSVVSHPEFLREGSAVGDFMEPSLLVVGGEEPGARQRVADLYTGLDVEPCLVGLKTAEMIKYACNAFHALKVTFANEIGALCSEVGVPGDKVMETLCRDTTLNISPAYLKPGFAFGGSCLPKDLRAMAHRASRMDLRLPLIGGILASNEEHLRRAIQAVTDLPVQQIGIYGLTFKENTDDLRESPVVALVEQLIGKGRNLRVFDPHIRLDRIYGANERFLLSAIPHISKLLDSNLEEILGWAEFLVLAQKPSASHLEAIRRSGVSVLSLAGDSAVLGAPAGC